MGSFDLCTDDHQAEVKAAEKLHAQGTIPVAFPHFDDRLGQVP